LVRIFFQVDASYQFIVLIVLYPYYKLAYIKLSWGGLEEQAAKIAAGNIHTNEKTVSSPVFHLFLLALIPMLI
jgi:hypothetical protein